MADVFSGVMWGLVRVMSGMGLWCIFFWIMWDFLLHNVTQDSCNGFIVYWNVIMMSPSSRAMGLLGWHWDAIPAAGGWQFTHWKRHLSQFTNVFSATETFKRKLHWWTQAYDKHIFTRRVANFQYIELNNHTWLQYSWNIPLSEKNRLQHSSHQPLQFITAVSHIF